jgi:hypothetical protein
MPTKPKESNTKRLDATRQMSAGLAKHFAGKSLEVAGIVVAVNDQITAFQAYLGKADAVAAAFSAWKQQLDGFNKSSTQIASRMLALQRFLRARFGPRSATLRDFGIAPARVPYKSPKVKTAAIEKSKATRVARHTMGRRQKQRVRGAASR